jgi:DNA-binding transcriptional LysR family regulator
VLLPEWLCKDALNSGKLKCVLEDYKTAPADVQFVWPAHREQNRKIKAFVDIAAKKLVNYFPAN